MGPINDVTGLISQFNKIEKEVHSKRVKQPQTLKNANTPGTKSSVQSVNVEISTSGKNLLRQEQNLLHYIKSLASEPTISPENLTDIQGKVRDEYYSDTKVLDKIADAIADLPAFKELMKYSPTVEDETVSSTISENKLAHIRDNMRKRVYDDERIIEMVVERILNAVEAKD